MRRFLPIPRTHSPPRRQQLPTVEHTAIEHTDVEQTDVEHTTVGHAAVEHPAPHGIPSPDRGDHELIAAVGAQDIEALRVLHRRHAPWLRARLLRRCADPDVVDDAVQDTFVAVWQGASRYSAQGDDAAAWIWTIAIRRMVSVLRGRGSQWIGGRPVPDTDAAAASAEDVVLLRVEHGDLGTAVARLSPELRAVIEATILDGLTVRETSQLLGVPEGTVKTRLMRAKARLREELA